MSAQDFLGIAFSATEDEPVVAALEVLSRENDKAALLFIEVMPSPLYMADGYVAGVWGDVLAQSRLDYAKEKEAVDKRCAAASRPIDSRAVEVVPTFEGTEAATAARHADLTVMLRPSAGATSSEERRGVFEEILFGSGRPVLLVPPGWRRGAIGRNILIGWNGKREAARALADAMPFIERADQVAIATVDAKPSVGGHGEHPGADITAHLARKGIKAELRNLDGLGHEEGEALMDEARARGADLVVIGGYGKARLREFVFGGVTRTLTNAASVPLLLSH